MPDGSVVTHLNHTCNARIGGMPYPVVDVHTRQRSPGGTTNVHAFFVFSPTLTLLHRIPYDAARPMFCDANRVYLFRNLEIPGVTGSGTELVLTDAGKALSLNSLDALDEPGIPLSKLRQ